MLDKIFFLSIYIVKKMNHYYSEMLLNGFPDDEEIKVQEIPLIINTIDTSYPFAFIDYEEDNVLGINYTVEDGTERFVIINKEHIVDIGVLYQQDIDILTEETEEESDVMYQ